MCSSQRSTGSSSADQEIYLSSLELHNYKTKPLHTRPRGWISCCFCNLLCSLGNRWIWKVPAFELWRLKQKSKASMCSTTKRKGSEFEGIVSWIQFSKLVLGGFLKITHFLEKHKIIFKFSNLFTLWNENDDKMTGVFCFQK